MSVTIAKDQDRIPTDKTAEQAADMHGAGSVYVDGKCYADILREQAEAAAKAAAEAESAAKAEFDLLDKQTAPDVAAESQGDDRGA